MTLKIYGLKNCDTCRKAIKWMEASGYTYSFMDFRQDGYDLEDVKGWIEKVGLDVIVNKRSTTWRELDDQIKENLSSATALDLIKDNPALIKRPVFDFGDDLIVGFTKKQQELLETKLTS